MLLFGGVETENVLLLQSDGKIGLKKYKIKWKNLLRNFVYPILINQKMKKF